MTSWQRRRCKWLKILAVWSLKRRCGCRPTYCVRQSSTRLLEFVKLTLYKARREIAENILFGEKKKCKKKKEKKNQTGYTSWVQETAKFSHAFETPYVCPNFWNRYAHASLKMYFRYTLAIQLQKHFSFGRDMSTMGILVCNAVSGVQFVNTLGQIKREHVKPPAAIFNNDLPSSSLMDPTIQSLRVEVACR